MTNYRFWPAFLKYAGMLFALLSVLFIIIVILFSYKLNQEINETAQRQTSSVQTTLAQHQKVNPTHDYFVVKHGKIIEASTPFSTRELETRFLQNSTITPYIDESRYGVFDVRTVSLSNERTLYSLTNVHDFHETKGFLISVLIGCFLLGFILMMGLAYYLAQRPIKVYEQLMQDQRLFIQNASHEMKTPIASLLLGTQYIDMLEHEHLSTTSRQTLAQMKTEVTYMQQLIDSMLEPDMTIKDLDEIHIATVLDEAVQSVEMAYHIPIKRLYARHLTYPILPLHLKQIVNILLENAVKHNESDVKVAISASKTINGIELRVSDDGVGIAKEEQQHIFKRFYRGNQNQKGSGIGLALLQARVHQYGGVVTVMSKKGKGTTFLIKL
ncbi:HAMP domain-containing histidine kinase [Staphylococcus agnetis]|uniref:sensor histidine kinase n=1 Tax=Staphylococcus agnetis TaxID=985762 RepID=UPI00208EC797|nr:HAMP domain-containing sensor histidine kinase [Staphylococcus agnetis]MCO4338573.1 HAMP domain-containing histidine kinase [Staphylococcus agnetis]MCO4340205.1 HAMP domain-containing histidine kinase [Staphylococcus agnetis]MCO4343791.1 HAMP domain-containing histidine kinase [Staphylococcus agnetis]MCO4347169.1 HAMP domain-containing histidine kinase [Staphylococcus agnetis]MCO4349606.1 HAMP domain-containing histidine kinase [Staphylococcus agnetis]